MLYEACVLLEGDVIVHILEFFDSEFFLIGFCRVLVLEVWKTI